MVLLTQNTHVAGFKTGCKSGHFSSFCCESIVSDSLINCGQSNLNNMFTGGFGIQRKSVSYLDEDTIMETAMECMQDDTESLSLINSGSYIVNNVPGYWSGNGKWSPVANLKYTTTSISSCTTTITTETTIISTTDTPKTVTCDATKWDQPCRHYWSVNSRNSYDTIACPVDAMKGRPAPSRWNNQHDAAWRYWVRNLPASLGTNKCDRDEWPPVAFMEKVGSPYTQWIRFVPSSANRAAGSLWKGICRSPKKETKYEGGPISGNTCTTIKSVIYTVNAMKMQFTNVFSYDGIGDNPCTPYITDDAGFALFTNDQWYADHVLAGYNTRAYLKAPVSSLTAGLRPPRYWSPAKRWLEHERDIFDALDDVDEYVPVQQMGFDPEDLVVDEGNSTRYTTPEELWEEYGLIKCRSHNCEKEKAAVGHYNPEEIQRKLALPTAEPMATVTGIPGSSSNPASGASVPMVPRETGKHHHGFHERRHGHHGA
jgi:hypothetical protein